MSETSSVYTAYKGNSYLFGGNAPYVEEMYENYLANPGSVPTTGATTSTPLQNVPPVDWQQCPRRAPPSGRSTPSPSARSRAAPRWWSPGKAGSELGRKRTAVQQLIAGLPQRRRPLGRPSTR
jgi:2-oxoglutarate dehydrogenase E1 component